MKMNAEPNFVDVNNVGETKRATIKVSSKIFDFFAKQIYSDKYTAIWRELVANAVDAQLMVGDRTTPVEITLPSILEPQASVRDFGCSMTHDFMMNKFMAFADASTKEDSNDFIGGFGIGSKAPLSYTDQYSIKCYMDGMLRVYSIFKDEEGCPCIAFLTEKPSSERTGVEVSFPVRQDDIERFNRVVVSTVEYFNPQPVLKNTVLKVEPIVYDARGDKWGTRAMSDNTKKSRIIVGGVAYPFEPWRAGYRYRNISRYANLGIDFFFEIGEVNIALSRESVEHDDALFKAIDDRLVGIAEDLSKQLSEKFNDCKTLWEAITAHNTLMNELDYELSNLLRKHATWGGQPLQRMVEFPYVPRDDGVGMRPADIGYINYRPNTRMGSLSGMSKTEATNPRYRDITRGAAFSPDAFDAIIIDNAPDRSILRIRALIEADTSKNYLFIKNRDASLTDAKILDTLGNPPASMIKYLADIAPMKITRAPAGAKPKPKFKAYLQTNRPTRDRYSSDNLVDILPVDGGMYIVMDNFVPQTAYGTIELALLGKPKNTVWLNFTDFKNSGIASKPEWIAAEVLAAKVKAEYLKSCKNLPLCVAVLAMKGKNQIFNDIERLSKLPRFPKQGPLAQYLKLYQRYAEFATPEYRSIQNSLNIKCDKEIEKLTALADEVKTRYPELYRAMHYHNMRSLDNDGILNKLF